MAVALASSPAVATAGEGETPLAATMAALDAAVPALLERHHVPGVSIAVLADGAVLARGHGTADAATGRSVGADDAFQAASISKAMAALLALRLVDQGRLDPDAPIAAILADVAIPHGPFDLEGVTIARLLAHTAGLDVPGYQGFPAGKEVQTVRESIAGASDAGGAALAVVTAPGEAFHYSGGGYALLELAIERASGTTFAEAARTLLFEPLDMAASSFPSDRDVPSRAVAVHDASGRPVRPHRFAVAAAAGLWSTAPDLARSLAGLAAAFRGEPDALWSQATAMRMLFPAAATENAVVFEDARWGLGLGLVRTDRGALLAFHPGDNPPGWHALVALLPETGDGFALLSNGDGGRVLRMELVCLWLALGSAGSLPDCADPAASPGAR